MGRESQYRTAYGVHCDGLPPCNGGRIIYLTYEEYDAQMYRPDRRWECPRCDGPATWDDGNFDEMVRSVY